MSSPFTCISQWKTVTIRSRKHFYIKLGRHSRKVFWSVVILWTAVLTSCYPGPMYFREILSFTLKYWVLECPLPSWKSTLLFRQPVSSSDGNSFLLQVDFDGLRDTQYKYIFFYSTYITKKLYLPQGLMFYNNAFGFARYILDPTPKPPTSQLGERGRGPV